MMKRIIAVSLAASSLTFAAGAHAEAGDIVVRLRATNVAPDESSSLGQKTNQAYGAPTATVLYGSPNANLKVDDNLIPEIDFSYYFTKNIAAELILATGTRHDVKTSGIGAAMTTSKLGSVDLLPPTLTLQWHFMPDQTFDPYVGAGATYVYSLDKNLKAQTVAGTGSPQKIRIDQDMWGGALQAGIDINLKDRWLVNFDVKKLWFGTDVKLNAPVLGTPGWQKIDNLDINPWVISVGIGKKF